MKEGITDMTFSFSNYLSNNGKEIYYYGNASHSLKDVLIWLNEIRPKTSPNIIMPTYIPAKLYRTILASGYEAKFYEINEDCRFNPQEIEDAMDENTQAIFVIHYFGQPADIAPVRELATVAGKYLIEDCAHVLLGSIDGTPMGAFGDCSIFSLRKMLCLSDGGILAFNGESKGFIQRRSKKVRAFYSMSHLLLSRLKYLYFILSRGHDPIRLARLSQKGYLNLNEKQNVNVKAMSLLSRLYLEFTNLEKHVDTRSENYRKLFRLVEKTSFLKPLRDDLPYSWTPYSFPVKVVGAANRDAIRKYLLRYGISCGCGWPESPFCEGFPRTRRLAESLIELPVSPMITSRQIERIGYALSRFGDLSTQVGDNNKENPEEVSLKFTF